MLRCASLKVNITEDTRKAPKVLIFEIGAVTPTVDFHRELVFAWFKIFAEVKFSFSTGALRVTDFLAVDPDVESRADTIEGDKCFFAFEVRRNSEIRTVRTYRVVFFWRVWLIFLKWISDVCVDCCTETFNFPVRWNFDCAPRAIIKGQSYRNQ